MMNYDIPPQPQLIAWGEEHVYDVVNSPESPTPTNNPVIQPHQSQHQKQTNGQSKSDLDAYFDQIDNNNSEANAQSESTGNVEQSNININNIQAGEYGYGPGITRPTPFFSGTLFLTDDGYGNTNKGGQISFVVPLGGGKSSRLSEELISARTRDIRIVNAQSLLSICNSARAQGLEINYENLPEDSVLHGCNGIFIEKAPVTQAAVDNSTNLLLQQMQKTINELKRTNESLQQQLNNINAPNPYQTTGG